MTSFLQKAPFVVLLAVSIFRMQPAQGAEMPPEPAREFRGGWVASVQNIDWPSQKGLPVEQQKKELIAILDRAVQLKLNAIILQVRPACDALYASQLEPWSEYLTGEMGKAPVPFYDPLEFAVDESHKRGLELHAWLNPYRAGIVGSKSPVPTNHISKAQPHLVRRYVKYLWLDPGEKGTQDHTIAVIADIVKRYDVDGIHFDDYFYPYQDKDRSGKLVDFPDGPSWKAYKAAGGTLSRNDWRRENVNMFIDRCYATIKSEKPWVKFGISPFGIWKPGFPSQIAGLNAYESLYADSRKWFVEGWCDYFAPQLYWNIDALQQSYPVLLKWWHEQNIKGRHLWPGISTARIGNIREPVEIANQIRLTRKQEGATGNIHWSIKPLMQNRKGISDLLSKELYTEAALIPASPWLNDTAPSRPDLSVRERTNGLKLTWQMPSADEVTHWVLQKRINEKWETEILHVSQQFRILESDSPNAIPAIVVVRAVNRYGILSAPAVFEAKKRRQL